MHVGRRHVGLSGDTRLTRAHSDFFTRGEQRGNGGHRGLAVRADYMQAGCKLPAAAAAPVAEHTCGQGADWRRALAGW